MKTDSVDDVCDRLSRVDVDDKSLSDNEAREDTDRAMDVVSSRFRISSTNSMFSMVSVNVLDMGIFLEKFKS